MKCTRQSPAIAALAAACCLTAACTEAPADRYIKACVAVATNMVEADSCRCMAPAYARVLTRDEFAALADVAEQGTALLLEARSQGSDLLEFQQKRPPATPVLMSAMRKIGPLHQAGVCGYGRRHRAVGGQ